MNGRPYDEEYERAIRAQLEKILQGRPNNRAYVRIPLLREIVEARLAGDNAWSAFARRYKNARPIDQTVQRAHKAVRVLLETYYTDPATLEDPILIRFKPGIPHEENDYEPTIEPRDDKPSKANEPVDGPQATAIDAEAIGESVARHIRGADFNPSSGPAEALPGFSVPPLPAVRVERPDALKALRKKVFEGRGEHIALSVVHGMPGVGKSVLAQMLCKDPEVHEAFPDGIFWFTVGSERGGKVDPELRARALARELAPSSVRPELPYREAVHAKRILVVLDDVWTSRDVEPLRADSPGSAVLITTRNAEIAGRIGAYSSLPAPFLDPIESRQMLAKWAHVDEHRMPTAGDEIVSQCKGNALMLSMLGAALRDRPERQWERALTRLRSTEVMEQPIGFAHYQHGTFSEAFAISLDALNSPSLVERYLALAVLLEDMSIPLPILQTLWQVDEGEASDAAELLIGRSLAQRVGTDGDAIRLHDLQLGYVRSRYSDPEALALIQGAVRLSMHVITQDPYQFPSQLVGRLLFYEDKPSIERLIEQISKGAPKPWLRLLRPALHSPGTPLLRTLHGHSDGLWAAVVAQDGERVVSTSEDNTLKVWDLSSGEEPQTLEGHTGAVYDVAMTPDGKRAVSASEDHTLKVWDLDSGKELRTLEGHSDSVLGVAMTPDGKRAVSASSDYTLKVWDLESGKEPRTLEGHSDLVLGVAMTPDGKRAVSASYDHTLKVWDLESANELRTLRGHSEGVFGVAMMPDSTRAVSASSDNTLKVWDLDGGQELQTLEGHYLAVVGVAMTPDGKRAVSASEDHTLKVWDLDSGKELRTLEGHSAAVWGVTVTPDGKRAVSASSDYTLKVWDLESGKEPHTRQGHSDPVWGVAITPDGKRAVSVSSDYALKVWDLDSRNEPRRLQSRAGALLGIAMTPDGRWAVSASENHTLEIWDLNSSKEPRQLQGHSDPVWGVATTPDGKRAVSASEDHTLKVWDLDSGKELRRLDGHSAAVWGVAMTPDGKRAASASEDHTLKVWDLDSGKELRTLDGHSAAVRGVAMKRDGMRVVSASWDHKLKVWDLDSGKEPQTLEGHSAGVWGLAVADGRLVVSVSSDHTVKVWNLDSGRCIATFYCEASAFCCALSSDGRIAVGDLGGRVYFLSLEDVPKESRQPG